MRKSFKYRIKLTKKQVRLLRLTLDECRWLYNQCLEQRILAFEELGQTLSMEDQHAMLTLMKEERQSLNLAHSQVLQNVIRRLDLAFEAFFRRCKSGEIPGFPRFRGHHRYQSFCYPQSGFSLEANTLKLSKIGKLRIILHRPVEGQIKTCTISVNAVGEWYVSFSCEVDAKKLPQKETSVGIDVGIESFATLSDGNVIENPRFLKKSAKNLAKIQCKKDKVEKGTPARKKYVKALAKVHNRIKNQREDFCHKAARKIVDEYQAICIEDLNITNMIEGSPLAKSILDVSWNRFRQFLIYKAEEAGRLVGLVEPAYTTQTCSQCGSRNKKKLGDRQHVCEQCGYKAHRDFNASLNILAFGLEGQGISPRSPLIYARE